MRAMYCPHLAKDREGKRRCSAGQQSYLPSAFELQEYCSAERYRLCPFYCKRQTERDAEALLGKERACAEGGTEAPTPGKDRHDQHR